jgi:hypothetical protein
MKKHKNTTKEDKYKKSKNQFQGECSEALFKMMSMMGRGDGESGMMGMMSKMMGGGVEKETTMMPQMMTEMMPKCLEMLLPTIPKERRVDFVMKMVAILMEKGCVGMSDEEKRDFVAQVGEKVKVY